jgi:hypothetical protein
MRAWMLFDLFSIVRDNRTANRYRQQSQEMIAKFSGQGITREERRVPNAPSLNHSAKLENTQRDAQLRTLAWHNIPFVDTYDG